MDGVEEALLKFEQVERGEGAAGGEVEGQGFEGGVAGRAVCLSGEEKGVSE